LARTAVVLFLLAYKKDTQLSDNDFLQAFYWAVVKYIEDNKKKKRDYSANLQKRLESLAYKTSNNSRTKEQELIYAQQFLEEILAGEHQDFLEKLGPYIINSSQIMKILRFKYGKML